MSRKLTPPEKTLWQMIARRITPLRPDDAAKSALEAAQAHMKAQEKALKKTPKHQASLAVTSIVQTKKTDGGREVDRKTLQRLQRGQMDIEATIDLHGFSVKQAEDELRAFLRHAHGRQLRCVLVIHGKGSLTGEAKIKRALPEWLRDMPDIVLTQAAAKPFHGGHGASYILLRRKRVTL